MKILMNVLAVLFTLTLLRGAALVGAATNFSTLFVGVMLAAIGGGGEILRCLIYDRWKV